MSQGTIPMRGKGVLALWHDSAPGHEAAFEDWYQTEHLAERLSIPGFVRGRRYEAVVGAPAFFTCYEVIDPALLFSDTYRSHTAAPTPLTQQIMRSGAVKDMSRTVCRIAHRFGDFHGAYAVAIILDTVAAAESAGTLIGALAEDVGVARAEIWTSAEAESSAPSAEEKMRGQDTKIAACLLIETLREDAAVALRDRVTAACDASVQRSGIYRFLCELDALTGSVEPA